MQEALADDLEQLQSDFNKFLTTGINFHAIF